jgi:hypothetical protein
MNYHASWQLLSAVHWKRNFVNCKTGKHFEITGGFVICSYLKGEFKVVIIQTQIFQFLQFTN